MSGMKDLLGGEPFAAYPQAPGHRGVATSVAAAASMRSQAPTIKEKIAAFLRDRGAEGATYTEIMHGCSLSAPTVCGRMKELTMETPPRVVLSGRTRPTPSRREANVYIAREFADAAR